MIKTCPLGARGIKSLTHYREFLIRGKFSCTKCGSCCSHIKPLVEKGSLPSDYLRADGGCVNLKDNLCVIYNERPEICRLEKTLKNVSDKDIAKMCKRMKDFKGKMDYLKSHGG